METKLKQQRKNNSDRMSNTSTNDKVLWQLENLGITTSNSPTNDTVFPQFAYTQYIADIDIVCSLPSKYLAWLSFHWLIICIEDLGK